ncbi:MAG: hypothetical protein KGY81_05920, partial [Phycisphaerae bacterium]|nr:hypothetical protein [Phycisphaerae bacterium]
NFGGRITYNGLVSAALPPGEKARVAGKWTLKGNLLEFWVAESDMPAVKDKVVQHRILGLEDGVMRTIFENEHRIEIYRR